MWKIITIISCVFFIKRERMEQHQRMCITHFWRGRLLYLDNEAFCLNFLSTGRFVRVAAASQSIIELIEFSLPVPASLSVIALLSHLFNRVSPVSPICIGRTTTPTQN